MKIIKALFIFITLTLTIMSCNNNCDCDESWDSSITYVSDDLVLHDGKCWIAVAQGRGVTPGPWLEDGNDIWEECTE